MVTLVYFKLTKYKEGITLMYDKNICTKNEVNPSNVLGGLRKHINEHKQTDRQRYLCFYNLDNEMYRA